MSIERPEAKHIDAVTPALDSIMTFKEYRERGEHSTPYVYKLENAGRELVYFGAHHTNDPDDRMLVELKARLEDFLGRHAEARRNALVLVEGGTGAGEVRSEREAASAGEARFTQFLAEREGVEVISPEPAFSEEAEAVLARGFSRDELATWYLLRSVSYEMHVEGHAPTPDRFARLYLELAETSDPGWIDAVPKRDELKELFLKDRARFQEVMEDIGRRVLEKTQASFRGETGEDLLDAETAEQHADPADFSRKGSAYNVIAAISSETRDRAIVRAIGRALAEGRDVFVTYGASHAVMQEPALKKIMETL